MLRLDHITKVYPVKDNPVHALKGISLNFRKNEFVSILGPSGCGKTTTLNIIGGLDHYTDGDLVISGVSTKEYTDHDWDVYRNHKIGFIFQSYNLMPNLTALQNLRFIAELKKESEDPKKMLDWVGLSARYNNYPSQMSGGQQQRVSIARALVKKPKLILADEPTAALDYATGIEVLSVIEDVVRSGKSVLMVTHNEEITKMANRVIRMRGGLIDEVIVNRHPKKATDLVW